MIRKSPAVLLLSAICACLRAQDMREVILAARRTAVVELIDASTLETFTRLHFDFRIERSRPSADGTQLLVDGYIDDRGCCQHYELDLASLKLSELNIRNYPIFSFASPDGRWRYDIRNFRGATLTTVNLKTKEAVELVPGLPAESSEGNWAGTGTWSGDRFYYYVGRPNHPGFLWTVLPGDRELGTPVAVDPFGETPGCRWHLAIAKSLVAAAERVFIYEPFGNKVDRFRCNASVPGGAWNLDPETGRVTGYIAPEFHFHMLLSSESGATLYGVDPGTTNWKGPVRLVSLDSRDGTIFKTRNFDSGVLQIAVGRLRNTPTGEVRVLAPKIAE